MKIPCIVAACASLGATTFAKQVQDGSSYTDGMGTTCTVDVVDTSGPGVTIQVTDSTGHTPATAGTAGSNSTQENPTCQNAPAAETNSPQPNEYRVKDGKLQKKNSAGKWVNMRKAKKGLKRPPRFVALNFGPGQEGTSLPPERL
jgi:hypothetical protein